MPQCSQVTDTESDTRRDNHHRAEQYAIGLLRRGPGKDTRHRQHQQCRCNHEVQQLTRNVTDAPCDAATFTGLSSRAWQSMRLHRD